MYETCDHSSLAVLGMKTSLNQLLEMSLIFVRDLVDRNVNITYSVLFPTHPRYSTREASAEVKSAGPR